RRGREHDLAKGPGRLTQALAVTQNHQSHRLNAPPLSLHRSLEAPPPVWATPRIGISKGVETPWRFVVPGHPALSGPRHLRVP
ncbi:MAG: DNA-3-methyladenine glycosylase, partial [Myxococcota bacterium]